MTKDLALLVGADQDFQTTQEFLAVDRREPADRQMTRLSETDPP